MLQAGLEAAITLTTYYHYVDAWVIALEKEHGRDDESGLQAFRMSQQRLSAFNRLQGAGWCSDEVSSAFYRGKLTLIAMNRLPVADFPDLAAVANLWVPVQGYYAVHAMGLAVFAALGQAVPQDHRRFRAAFSQTVCRLLPVPLCALCGNGPQPKDFTFKGISISPETVAAQSNLATPTSSNVHHLVGKSLSTTRKKLLDEAFAKARRGKVKPNRARRNLTLDERGQLTRNLHDVSIADLLYRMRIRANYDDPEMYLAAFANPKGAVAHYVALTRLVNYIAEGLRAIIRQKIGGQAMDQLEARLT